MPISSIKSYLTFGLSSLVQKIKFSKENNNSDPKSKVNPDLQNTQTSSIKESHPMQTEDLKPPEQQLPFQLPELNPSIALQINRTSSSTSSTSQTSSSSSSEANIPISILKKQTQIQAQELKTKASLYATVNLLNFLCNPNSSKNDDQNLKLIIRDLFKPSNPGFRKIYKTMKQYIPNISYVKMLFFYYTFAFLLPKLYINASIEKILHFTREKISEKDKLLDFIIKSFNTFKSYLSDYNKSIEKFKNDDNASNLNRDQYVNYELKEFETLGYKSIDSLYQNFFSTIFSFNFFSSNIYKFQMLEFGFLNNKYKKIQPIAYFLGIVPYYCFKIFEKILNTINKKAHSSIMKILLPKIIQSIVSNNKDITYTINKLLCTVYQNALDEFEKNPENNPIIIPDIQDMPIKEMVDNELICELLEQIYTLLIKELCKTREDLKNPNIFDQLLDGGLIQIIKYLMPTYKVLSTKSNIYITHINKVDAYNILCIKPDKLEESLKELITQLNNIFDPLLDQDNEPPISAKELQEKRTILQNQLIENLKGFFSPPPSWQKGKFLLSCKTLKVISDKLPDALDPNDQNIKNNILYTEELFKSIYDIYSQSDPGKNSMEKCLQSFLDKKNEIDYKISQIKKMLEISFVNLKKILEELDFNLNNFSISTIELQIQNILLCIKQLKKINKNSELNKITANYQVFYNRIEKHHKLAFELQKLILPLSFKSSALFQFMQSQRAVLLDSSSPTAQENLQKEEKEIEEILNNLQILQMSEEDIKIITDQILKISNASLNEINDIYEETLKLIENKILENNRSCINLFIECKTKTNERIKNLIPSLELENSKTLKSNIDDLNSLSKEIKTSLINIDMQEIEFESMIKRLAKGFVKTPISFLNSALLGPKIESLTKSLFSVTANKTFLEGLTHAFMKQFAEN